MAGARPFHGRIRGTLEAIEPFAPGSEPACNANFSGDPTAPGASVTLRDEATVRFSHLGAGRLDAVSCIDPLSPFSSGQGILHAANGDQLWIEFENLALPSAADPTLIEVTGTQRVTGGTGRFTGASGSQACTFTIRLATPARGTIDGGCDGTLAYDAGARRRP
jgi:hypothetical protein